jgi:pimeloyl-ACP methyl ester carboxylesterase
MGVVHRAVAPVAAVLHAARRPATYTGQVREAASTLITMGMWPLGFVDRGLAGIDSLTEHPSSVDTPVLLVHGYGANKSNWMFLRRYLQQAGFGRVHALNYNALRADIPSLAELCAERADELRDRFGTNRVHIIGHSLGGVVARYAVQVRGLDNVGVCITIVSPNGGVRLARYGSPLAVMSPLASGLQLRPESKVMTELRRTARPMATRFVAYYSNLDLLVPARRAMMLEPELEAANILVKDQGHLSIMFSRALAQSVVDQLAAAEGLPGYGTPVRGLPQPGTSGAITTVAPLASDAEATA